MVAVTTPVSTHTSQQSDPVAPRLSVALKQIVFHPDVVHLRTALLVAWSRTLFSQVALLMEGQALVTIGSPSGSNNTSGLKLRKVFRATTMPSGKCTLGALLNRVVGGGGSVVVVVVLRNVGATSVGTGDPPIFAVVEPSAVFSDC